MKISLETFAAMMFERELTDGLIHCQVCEGIADPAGILQLNTELVVVCEDCHERIVQDNERNQCPRQQHT